MRVVIRNPKTDVWHDMYVRGNKFGPRQMQKIELYARMGDYERLGVKFFGHAQIRIGDSNGPDIYVDRDGTWGLAF